MGTSPKAIFNSYVCLPDNSQSDARRCQYQSKTRGLNMFDEKKPNKCNHDPAARDISIT